MKNKQNKNIFYWIIIIAILLLFTSCNKNPENKNQENIETQNINASNSEMQLNVAINNSHSAVITILGIDFPDSFKSKYEGYSEGKVPYYAAIYFGDYAVSLMYIPSLIEEYSKNEDKTEIPLSALKANAMKVTGSGNDARSDEVQDCIVNVSSTEDSLTFDFELSKNCDIDLNIILEYKVEVFALGDFQKKTFEIKQGSNSNKSQNSPTKRDLKVTLINERTAEFCLTDPDLKDFYQVGENLTYNWKILFFDSNNPENQWEVYSMTPYVNSLTSVSKDKLTCGFLGNGSNVGYIENGVKQCETQFDFQIEGKTMVWTVHNPELFRLGEEYDKSSFDFRDFDTFLVQHFTIENNTAKNVYEDQYDPKEIIYDNDFTENYNIKPVPDLFSDSGDGEYFKPISSYYVIVETIDEAYHPVDVKEYALYNLTETGIVVDECHKFECDSKKDFKYLMYGENDYREPLGRLIEENVTHTSGKIIYFKSDYDSIGYPLEDIMNFQDQCNEDGYYRQSNYKGNEDRLIYFSKAVK